MANDNEQLKDPLLKGTLLQRKSRGVGWKLRHLILNINCETISFYRSVGKLQPRMNTEFIASNDINGNGTSACHEDDDDLCLHLPKGSWRMKDVLDTESLFVIEFQIEKPSKSSTHKLSKKRSFRRIFGGGGNSSLACYGVDDNDRGIFRRGFPPETTEETDAFAATDDRSTASTKMITPNTSIDEEIGSNEEEVVMKFRKRRTIRLYFKCPGGGNEKAMWRGGAELINSFHDPEYTIRTQNNTWRYRTGMAARAQDMKIAIKQSSSLRSIMSSLPNSVDVSDIKSINTDKVKEYKVLPAYAYPNQWMTKEELDIEVMRPSSHFHDPSETFHLSKKPPNIGSLHVEVLCCCGLPKLDRFSPTDAATYLVCGPYAFATDVIQDSNNPRWLSKSRRAAVFPLSHAYARLYAGVFDDDGDFAGRIVVDVASLRPDSIYDVSLPLRETAQVYCRRPRGVIRLRFRVTWNHQRAAVLSYMPKSMDSTVSIPCGDGLTFRCVAVTVHGADMPGKFSRTIMNATFRECQLYKVQIKYIIKNTIKDVIVWNDPIVSTYVFYGWMHCVYSNSVACAFPYLIGFVVVHLLKNYIKYNIRRSSHGGFAPLTIKELLCSLLAGGKDCTRHYMKPIEIEGKRRLVSGSPQNARKPLVAGVRKSQRLLNESNDSEEPDIIDVDHTEFPFSQRKKYKKMSIRDSIVIPSSMQLSRRSSMVDFTSSNTELPSQDTNDENEIDNPGLPEQDVDIQIKRQKKTIVEELAGVKEMIQKCTMWSFNDLVFAKSGSDFSSAMAENKTTTRGEESETSTRSMENYLGINTNYNPVKVATERYAGPIIQILQIGLRLVRAIVNLFIWKDPFLSFWFLIFCICLIAILVIFPWRLLMFALGFTIFGPQNMIIKKLKKKHIQSDAVELSSSSILPSPLELDGDEKECLDSDDKLKDDDILQPFFGHSQQESLTRPASKNTMEVVVPYSPLRKDRFYDWPPDPSSSSVLSFSRRKEHTNTAEM